MVLTTARFDRGFSMNAMAEKRYSDRRLRPWPPTYAEKMAKSRWMASNLEVGNGVRRPASAGLPMGPGGTGVMYNGKMGPAGYRYGPPPMLTRQKSDIFLNVKSSSYLVNNIAARKVKNIAGMTAVVDSDSNLEEVRRMRRHSTQHAVGGGQVLPHHRLQKQATFFHLNPSSRSRSKSMDDFTTNPFLFENGYNGRYRARNGKLNNGSNVNNSHSIGNNLHNSNSNNNSSSSPSHSGIHGNGLRHFNNLNGGHSYSDRWNGSAVPGGGRFTSMRNHSMDNLLDSEINYESYYQPSDQNRPKFVAVTSLEDVQAVRCAEFHPNGRIYAVGSNSKTFRICEYPPLSEIREDHTTYQPTVLFKRTKHHKGSIYCMAWSPVGDLIATGSNDKTVKLMRFNENQKQLEGQEIELTMHDGTVRDLCFLEDTSNKSSLLISGGAGDCKIYVTDCETSTPFQALSGHGGHVLSLYNWGSVMFVSGSQDKTVRFWDLRTRGCVNMVTPATSPGSRQGSPVAAVCVDPSGRLLVSGHEDSSCVLYDIRGNRPIQCFKPHASDVRSIRFSPSAYYLLTAGYDNKLVLTDLQGDLTMPLPSVVVAQHADKVISGRWHPVDFSFLSTSADKTATLWALPPI
ncbi:WD repeat-containing protein 47 isoform X5 [Wyeomyia smithii]|uniref:WD repeat-containing protein 47 isoform X5 n=1 Tax=Wyeomyia smithii TaxID=174621 RepID=UPI002468009D|nr:WD repeat-containing protein 47 isoform X5 [Wyeomyia smithii]